MRNLINNQQISAMACEISRLVMLHFTIKKISAMSREITHICYHATLHLEN